VLVVRFKFEFIAASRPKFPYFGGSLESVVDCGGMNRTT